MKTRHPEKINKPINPIKKKPYWIRSKVINSKEFFKTKTIVNQDRLKTVCQEANCPNITECWSKRHATFLIMGDTCTRACAFCDVRDDLEDGGSNHFREVVEITKKNNPNTTIEILTPDFLRKGDAYKQVIKAKPDVFNHNIETVPSMYRQIRPGSRYFGSLDLLKKVKEIDNNIFTKSGLMVGFGETKNEILQVMEDLRTANVDFLTIGQYLQPSKKHYPLNRYYLPEEFQELKDIALSKGFLLVSSSPLTRSSYHADEDFFKLRQNRISQANAKSFG